MVNTKCPSRIKTDLIIYVYIIRLKLGDFLTKYLLKREFVVLKFHFVKTLSYIYLTGNV